ncbi:zinc dependent phospholipase C family protein [Anaerocolumna xylanovorans]|uniref:Zinc dependent phospholipase C n=1 Tax=Anaerocolumna xylanovorans DSM 12503 TaxID=1121345 RepID=A0A1M7Y3B6_9FIRM|nr:zinc dependent phospholipase C family protein [Anaerocolumna xylanovorans]SHO46657.1 Zinc dependent phospholipase C [Anaerocolumna xylanovorans DSM 12503]
MPSTYAHYRLGQEVVRSLPDEMQEIIKNNKELYDIGLHGPDILFYYKPLFANRVNQTGFGMHDEPASKFFESAGRVIMNKRGEEAYLAYICGFICHFVLDSECHGYIDEKIESSGVSHTEIEVEFDRDLLVRDGHDPISCSLTDHIVPSEKNARIIADFFSGITKEEVKASLESMKKFNKLLIAPHRGKRLLINGLLAMTGNYKEMHGLLVNYKANPKCEDSTEKLRRLYVTSVRESIRLITAYEDSIWQEVKLDARYRLTFGSKDTDSVKEEVFV